MNDHEEGITWLKLAASTKPKSGPREVCLRRAIAHLEKASQCLKYTDRYPKSLRNLAITYWMLATDLVGCGKKVSREQDELVEAYVMALRHYANFTEEKGQVITIHDNEYCRCLKEALAYCKSLPARRAVTMTAGLLDVIPANHSSYRFKCLLTMSDVVEEQANKYQTNAENGQVRANVKDDGRLYESKSMVINSLQVKSIEASTQIDQLRSDLTQDELLLMLRRYQRPSDKAHHLHNPSSLSPVGKLLELGRAKHYFEAATICQWLNTEWPGIQAAIRAAIENGFRRYRTVDYASACLLDIQQIHSHNAYRLLCTLNAAYSVFTTYKPRFSVPTEELVSYSRVRLALDTAIRSIQKDQADIEDVATDRHQILELMITLLREAKFEFEAAVKADRMSSSPLEALRRLARMWRPFEDLLDTNMSLDKKELQELLLLRRAHDMAASYDKGNFMVILEKRLSCFETKDIANTCLIQLFKCHHDDPGKLLSILYRVYPPRCSSSLITEEEALRKLSVKEIRSQIHLAMLCYDNHSSDVTSGATREPVRYILTLLRRQLIRQKCST